MDDSKYEIGFKIILHAGDAKSKAMDAISCANEYQFDKARVLIKEAQRELKSAHQVQTDIMAKEANGNGTDLNILLVHSQDHLIMAMMSIENARQMVILNEKIMNLEQQIKGGIG